MKGNCELETGGCHRWYTSPKLPGRWTGSGAVHTPRTSGLSPGPLDPSSKKKEEENGSFRALILSTCVGHHRAARPAAGTQPQEYQCPHVQRTLTSGTCRCVTTQSSACLLPHIASAAHPLFQDRAPWASCILYAKGKLSHRQQLRNIWVKGVRREMVHLSRSSCLNPRPLKGLPGRQPVGSGPAFINTLRGSPYAWMLRASLQRTSSHH